MKLLIKNDYTFASGIFWQIADEGRRSLNFNKLAKDTRHDLYCHIKAFSPTWGFCRREELYGSKKVASLGKYIISASGLLNKQTNSIIVYKFKSVDELDENDLPLTHDLYGYIILLNGTICPDEGEYVADFGSVYESIIQKANRYEIDYLYLTSDVATQFFSIYELIMDNINQVDTLKSIFNNLNQASYNEFRLFLTAYKQNEYLTILDTYSHDLILKLIKEPFFEAEYKRNKDVALRFIINSIYTLGFTSDEAYWGEDKLKYYHKQSLFKPLKAQTNQIIKLSVLLSLFIILFSLIYTTFIQEDEPVNTFVAQPIEVPKVMAVNPLQLINKCIVDNDRYFTDLESWVLKSLKCDSLTNTLTFDANTRLTFNDFAALIGESKGITFNNQVGEYKTKYWLKNKSLINLTPISHGQILTNLEQAATDYSFSLQIQNGIDVSVQTFTINSSLSPVFLLKQHVFDDVLIKEIQMTLNQSDGLYNWIISGEFKK